MQRELVIVVAVAFELQLRDVEILIQARESSVDRLDYDYDYQAGWSN